MSITDYLLRAWRRLIPGTPQILNHLGVPSSGIYLIPADLPCVENLRCSAPSDANYEIRWEWIVPMKGAALFPDWQPFAQLTVPAGAQGSGTIVCVWTRDDGAEFRSKPYRVRVLEPSGEDE